MNVTAIRLAAVLWCAGAASQAADLGGPPRLDLSTARTVMSAAMAHAREAHAPGAAVAIVDEGGHLVLLERLDHTFAAAPEISLGKARTAALFKRPTRDLEKTVNEGRVTMVALSSLVGFTPLQGGVPLVVDGAVIGAVGVSGAASAQQDDAIAQAASESFASRVTVRDEAAGDKEGADVVHLPRRQVSDAFRHGAALHESDRYKVHASRREAPGDAEVHVRDADVFYVVDGSATFVTGGQLVDGHPTEEGEIRGAGIDGGATRQLGRGDVVVVPAGVPHWFKRVSAPLTYFVVKSSR